jgi:hypothetical protein
MCIVIDTNCFVHVFSIDSKRHPEFKPVYDWLIKGRGKIVYGGSKYRDELKLARKFIPIFAEFSRKNKLVRVPDEDVDEYEEGVKEKLVINGVDHIHDERYNDSHLIAIFSISGCKLLCSNDNKSFAFINDKQYYKKDRKPPSFYTSKRNANLLCDQYISPCCK